MNIPAILEDLIKDFQEQRRTNLQEIEWTDQLMARIKRPFAFRFFQAGFSLFLELLLWVAFMASVGGIIFMERLYPFVLLSQIPALNIDGILPGDMRNLTWILRGMFLLLGLCFLWIARLLANNRKKAKALNAISKALKVMMEQSLNRRSAIRDLTTKYPVDLAENNDTVVLKHTLDPGVESHRPDNGHNDILL
ncbi:MAG TPA: hypothetical protein VFL76_08315 [Edaphocola sp.]|nr:hypothetical protein [Edaphocola sp.]